VGVERREPRALGERILLLTPTGRDAELLARSLEDAGFTAAVCPDMEALCEAMPFGAAVVLVAEEALGAVASSRLDATLAQQPSWSDLPILVLLASGATLASSRDLLARFSQHGNLTLLERPVRSIALLSTLRAAVRARHRQYEVRDHLVRLAVSQAALERSESRYRSLTLASASIVWITDPNGEVVAELPLWQSYTGQAREQYQGMGWTDAIHPEDREPILAHWRRALERREAYQDEYRLRRKDGEYRRVTARGIPVHDPTGAVIEWVGTCTDVEDERRAAEHLRQGQRLEAVGSLAGGVAHEVNNMMTAVIGFGNIVLKSLPADHEHYPDVAEMVKAAHRAAGITRQLLAFTRQQILQLSVVDLNQVIGNVTKMLGSVLGADVELVTQLDPQAGRVRADPGQLEQVIVNLALNARHAMQSGGRLRLATGNRMLDGRYSRDHPGIDVKEGAYAVLSVTDTGTGMDAVTRSRAFEPFFTTKPVGQGTGLGLSTAYGIVKQSGGYIWLYSEPDQGTTVKVYLPMVTDPLESAPAPIDIPRGSGETILVVEDEEAVRILARRTLEEAGYRVMEAANGKEGLEMMRTTDSRVGLVLCDVILPGFSGPEFVRKLASLRPEVPVLYMSGYPGLEVVERGLIAREAPFLEKPFSPDSLASAVRRLLDRSEAALGRR